MVQFFRASILSVTTVAIASFLGCESRQPSLVLDERNLVRSAISYCSQNPTSSDCSMNGRPAAIFWEQDLMADLTTDSTCKGIRVFILHDTEDNAKRPPINFPSLMVTFRPGEADQYWTLLLTATGTPVRATANSKETARMVCAAVKGEGAQIEPQ